MGSILSQNAKMKKSSQNGYSVYNFGTPALKSQDGTITCPNARQCAVGCYAQSGTYRFKNVVNAYEERLKLTRDVNFVDILIAEIRSKTIQAKAKGEQCVIRIHDSGDFYSKEYAEQWYQIIRQCPDTRFYAYTKMVSLFESLNQQESQFDNFTIIYSFGGSEDNLIDCTKHRHAKVFESETALIDAGYVNASQDDMIAAFGPSLKIGLVYHGNKKYANTAWHKVA